MHGDCLGVGKFIPSEWFDSKNHDREWYIGGAKAREFNRRLLGIHPPSEITRTPKELPDPKLHASEWRNLNLYYVLVYLKGLMPEKYLRHWLLFVYGMYVFLQPEISDDEHRIAEGALSGFVSQVERLYGKRFMRFNVHLLLHIARFVKKYGSLWAWSTYPFEHINGVIQTLYHGTQDITLQICKAYTYMGNIKNRSEIFDRPDCSAQGEQLFQSLMSQCRIRLCLKCEDDLRLFGVPYSMDLSLNQKLEIEQLLETEIENEASSYDRFIYKNVLYNTTQYTRLEKRHNSTILTQDNELVVIADLIAVKPIGETQETYIVSGIKIEVLSEELCKNGHISTNLYSFIGKETSISVFIKPSSIKKKCVRIPYQQGKLYISYHL
ncbi:hypothetical protein QAD02_020291 [Eretmocerus hayati]|uniref:Uncharacterized protein n=1 Tax=Eretmocerus hayati TaxID=131215 RepID=A0ACC2PPH8_9HYME|nr:hypothetical protein QAD02_020291 [Eretmocerus hayati]